MLSAIFYLIAQIRLVTAFMSDRIHFALISELLMPKINVSLHFTPPCHFIIPPRHAIKYYRICGAEEKSRKAELKKRK